MKKQIFILENLDCANCANKIEKHIQKMPGMESAQVVFATKQLRLTSNEDDSLMRKIQSAVDEVEPGIVVMPYRRGMQVTPSQPCNDAACDIPSNQDSASHVDKNESSCCDQHNHDHRHTTNNTPNHDHGSNVSTTAKVEDPKASRRKERNEIITGAVLFVLLMILNRLLKPYFSQYTWLPWVITSLFLLDYLFLGSGVLWSAIKNIRRGQIFDENFLMSIASIGAFIIGEHPEAVAVILFYRIGEYFEDLAVDNSRKAIVDALDMRPEAVERIDNGQAKLVPIEAVSVGDILQIKPGERIPIDGVCIDGTSQIDTSPITGESKPVSMLPGREMLSGCINKTGLLKMRVTKPLEESMSTRILDAVENAAANKPKVDRFITRFSKVYTPLVCLAALIVAILPPLLNFGPWNEWILKGLTFLVVSCPCALVISVPMTFFAGIGRGSREGILFKGGASMEMISQIRNVVMDKTGTITEGRFAVREISSVNDNSKELLQLAASAEQNSTHPIAQSLVDAAIERNISLLKLDQVEEIAGRGISAKSGDMQILCGNRKWMEENQVSYPEIAEHGTEVFVAKNRQFAGRITVADAPKEGAKEAIFALKNRGLHTVMLTGDSEVTAQEIAREVGVEEVHAQMHPDEKLNVMREVREKNGPVMFIGDGINDAPVLAGADVSAAMGSGADAAIEAADLVFLNSKMSSVVKSIDISKKVLSIATQNIVFALGIKLLVMILSVLGFANMWLAVFADVGVSLLCILNAMRLLRKGKS